MSTATDLRLAVVDLLHGNVPCEVYDSRTRAVDATAINVATPSGGLVVGAGHSVTCERELAVVVECYAKTSTDAASAALLDSLEATVEAALVGTPAFRAQYHVQRIDRMQEYSPDSKASSMRLTLRCVFRFPDEVPDVAGAGARLREIWGEYDIDGDDEADAESLTEVG